MFRFIWGLLTFILLFSHDALAQVTCDPKPMGDINVIWGSDNIQYDFTKSQSQMDRMENDTKNPYDRSIKTHVGGLMQGGVAIKSQVQVATLEYPRVRKICQWIDRMDVHINISPTIFIAREHQKGSCKHKAILEHEMKHVFVDREVVKKYIPLIKADLITAVKKVGIVGPKDAREAERYQKKITDYMEQALTKASDKMYAERSIRQQAVDSLEEYERVSGLCG